MRNLLTLAVISAAALAAENRTAVLAGGCFWGVEAVFEQLKGVSEVTAGYAGGAARTAHYEEVGSGRTGHAEAVRVTFDPAQISYNDLLRVFFEVAHDPTQKNRQGPDVGSQYRSAIFYADEEQKQAALAYIQASRKHIVTEVTPLGGFYPAEAYHQRFVERNPGYPYVVVNDLPKLAQLRRHFPELLASRQVR